MKTNAKQMVPSAILVSIVHVRAFAWKKEK